MQKLSLNKLSIHPSDTLTEMYTQQAAYIKAQSLWVKAYGLDSYPITKQTIYFDLQYWNHSGCLSLLPNSPTAFFCCNWKEFSKHSRWQVTLFCDAQASSVIAGRRRGSQSSSTLPAKQPCNANTCLQMFFRLTFTLLTSNPRSNRGLQKNPTDILHCRLFMFYWLTI